MSKIYQIIDWDTHYENAKSRTIEDCSRCYFPNKQDGLGYGRLLRMPNGEAMYGAFVATAMICSKQKHPREGYLTDTGVSSGCPLTAQDISIKTQFSEKTIQAMLDAVCLENIGWMRCITGDTKVSAKYPSSILEVSASKSRSSLEGRKEGKKEGTPPALKISERISLEKELERVTREIRSMGQLADYDSGSQKWARLVHLLKRQKEICKTLGVVA